MEKLVSLIRFSFAENAVENISQKIRHFYDLYFLMTEKDCAVFIQSTKFEKHFNEILKHDREIFGESEGWQKKSIVESPLVNDFENIWKQVKGKYHAELSALAYTQIPYEGLIAKQFQTLIYYRNKIQGAMADGHKKTKTSVAVLGCIRKTELIT